MTDISPDVAELRAMLDVLPNYIRQAHEAVRDIRTAIRDGQAEAHRLIETDVASTVESAVTTQLEEVTRAAERAMKVHAQQIAAMFDKLSRKLQATDSMLDRFIELPPDPESMATVRKTLTAQRKGGRK